MLQNLVPWKQLSAWRLYGEHEMVMLSDSVGGDSREIISHFVFLLRFIQKSHENEN